MEQQRMKLSVLKMMLQSGEQIADTCVENGRYIIQMTNGPELPFDAQYKPAVDDTIRKAAAGVIEDTFGGSSTATSPGGRPGPL